MSEASWVRVSPRFAASRIAAISASRAETSPWRRRAASFAASSSSAARTGKICRRSSSETARTRAAERLRLDQIDELKIAQRLSYRRLARSQLLGDPRLHEPVTGFQLATEDSL